MKKFIENAIIMIQQNGSCTTPKGIVCSECILDFHRKCTVFPNRRIALIKQYLREYVELGEITEEELFEFML